MIRGSVAYREAVQTLTNYGEAGVAPLKKTLSAAEKKLLTETMKNRRKAFQEAAIDAQETAVKIKHGSHGVREHAPETYRLGAYDTDAVE